MLCFVNKLRRGTFLAASSPLRYCPPRSARTGQGGTQHRGQSGRRPGNAPVLGASHGFLPALRGGSPALRLRFVVAFVRLPCGFGTGFLLGSPWVLACSSPVPPPGRSFPPISNHSGFGLPVAAPGAGQGRIVAGLPALPDPATGGCFSLFALCSIAEWPLFNRCSWRGSLASPTVQWLFLGLRSGFVLASS